MGNAYVVDLSGLQQINEDTGTTRAVRRTILEPPKKASPQEGRDEEEDERGVALREDSELVTSFIQALFGLLYEVFNSMVSCEGWREGFETWEGLAIYIIICHIQISMAF